jgi:hypothetical protein
MSDEQMPLTKMDAKQIATMQEDLEDMIVERDKKLAAWKVKADKHRMMMSDLNSDISEAARILHEQRNA